MFDSHPFSRRAAAPPAAFGVLAIVRRASLSSIGPPAPARTASGRKATLSAAQGDGSAHQDDSFASQSDAFAPQGDGFGRKVTLFAGSGAGACGMCQHPPRLPAFLAFPAFPVLPVFVAALLLAGLAAPLAAQGGARESLGVFGEWGAFRDSAVPRCYAIAEAQAPPRGQARDQVAYASVGTWPRQQVRGQVHVRLSRQLAGGSAVTLSIGGQSFALAGGGGDAWARDRAMDAGIVAAMRSAGSMSVSARDSAGRRFTDRYGLAGAATAMDAATVGCARIR
jgi:hypothetical protein